MFERIKKIIKRIKQKHSSGLRDNILLRDEITIRLIKDGKVIEEKHYKGHTWQTYGKEQVVDALTTGGNDTIKILWMNCNGTGGSSQSTTNSQPTSTKARFVATWGTSGAITGITQFRIRKTSGGSDMSIETVGTFTKPDGVSMEITWDTTPS